MSRSLLEIILNINKQGSGATQAEKELSALEKTTKGLNSVLGVFGLALTTKAVFDFANASREANRVEKDSVGALEEAAKGLADYGEALRLGREATKGMASDQQIAASEAVLFGAGLATNAQQAADLASAGTVLSSVFASAGASQELFVRLLSSGSQVLFNNFGITNQMVKAKQDELEATRGLSGEEGRMQAIKEVLIGQANRYKDSLSEETIAAGQAETAQKNFMSAFGGLVNELDKATGATGLTTWFLDLETQGAKAWGTVFEGVAALSAMNRATVEASGAMDQYRISTGQATQAQIDAEHAVADAAAAQEDAATATAAAAEAEAEAFAALGPLNSSQIAAGHSADEMNAGEQALARGMAAARQRATEEAQAIRDLAASRQENLQAMAGESAVRQNLLSAKEAAPELGARITEQRQAVFDLNQAKEKEQEQADKRQTALAKKSADTMGQAIKDATKDLATDISSAVSDAVSGVNQDVIGDLMGLDNAEANAGEAVRRMAAVAGGGIADQWAPSLAAQLTGVQDKTAQAFVSAFQTGDDSKLKAAAQQLALNPIVELFDAQMIANQVEQKLKTEGLQQALNDKVNAILGEKGLPAVQSVTQQVGQAATDTGIATGQVQQSTTDMAASAEVAGAKMKTSFDGAITQINIAIQRLQLAIGLTERWGEVAGQTAGKFNALNPPAAGSSLVPNGAQRKMGGQSPL